MAAMTQASHRDGYERVEYQDARAGTTASAEQQQIEIPKFVTLSDDYALARPRANALQLMDTSDEAYLALHRPMEVLEQRAKESERNSLELERKKLRATLERLTKREAARGDTQKLLERDRERQQEIKEARETLMRYDELLSNAPPDNIGSSLSPAELSDDSKPDQGKGTPDTENEVTSDRTSLRKRAKRPSVEATAQPAQSSKAAAQRPSKSRKTNSVAATRSLVVDIPAGSRPTSTSSTVATAATTKPTEPNAARSRDSEAQSSSRSSHPKPSSTASVRQSRRLASATSAKKTSPSTSSPALPPPPSALQQSFIEDSNLRLQLFPPVYQTSGAPRPPVQGSYSKVTRTSPRRGAAPTHDLAFGSPTPEAAVQARDFDLTASWLLGNAPSEEGAYHLRAKSSRRAGRDATGAQTLSVRSPTRSSPRRHQRSPTKAMPSTIPDSQGSQGRPDRPSQESVVPETEFGGTSPSLDPLSQPQAREGEAAAAAADSDEAVEQELVPTAGSSSTGS